MTNLSIIILNYNTRELTVACVRSLLAHYKKQIDDGEFEIIIVDNASADESVSMIQKQLWFSQVKLVQNKENVGFSKGCNRGSSHAKGNHLLFLNSDTQMLDNGLVGMLNYLEKHESVGILGGRLQNTDGSSQASAGVFYTLPRVLLLLIGAERLGKLRYSPEKIASVDWVSGAMLMIDKKLFEKLGGFDEQLFMYMEDMELCFRVKKGGETVVFYPECVVKHISHGSSNRGFAIVQIYKGLLYFYKKHTNLLEYSIVKGLLVAKATILIMLGVILGNKSLRETYTKALQATL